MKKFEDFKAKKGALVSTKEQLDPTEGHGVCFC